MSREQRDTQAQGRQEGGIPLRVPIRPSRLSMPDTGAFSWRLLATLSFETRAARARGFPDTSGAKANFPIFTATSGSLSWKDPNKESH